MPNRKPRKTTLAAQTATAAMPQIPPELIDHLVQGPMSAEAVNAASVNLHSILTQAVHPILTHPG